MRLMIVLSLLILIGLEIFHLSYFMVNPGITVYLCHSESHDPYFDAVTSFGPNWWFILHMVQTPLVVLVGIGFLILS